jgi:hypothetical protein
VGDKDCADAIMRLKAEYFFNQVNIDSMRFKATNSTDLSFPKWMRGERYRLKGTRLAGYNSGIFFAGRLSLWYRRTGDQKLITRIGFLPK